MTITTPIRTLMTQGKALERMIDVPPMTPPDGYAWVYYYDKIRKRNLVVFDRHGAYVYTEAVGGP